MMKKFNNYLLSLLVLFFVVAAANGQSFSGTNAPGSFQDFAFSVSAGVTNLSITVPETATNYSDLLLSAGVSPTDTSYDFIALGKTQTNSINLELPELKKTNYVLRVRTPSSSQAHGFIATISTNVSDLRSIARPATKSLVTFVDTTITSNSWQYFRVDAVTNLASGWRVVVYSTNATTPDVYLQTNSAPNATNYWKRSVAQNPDTLYFTNNEAFASPYIIGVFLPATTNVVRYTLAVEYAGITNLVWDPGTTHLGTQIYTNQSQTGGDYYFRIIPQNTSVGAWRTALNVQSGEAHVYLQKGILPTITTATYKSERVGSDGFVVPSTVFNSGEEWFIMVRSTPGAQWNLVTGEPYVLDLGTVAADASSGSGNLPVGAEGMRFFKTTVPPNTLAWRLWLNGLTNSLLVKRTGVPVPAVNDLSQAGQMLVVPPYLIGGQLYFVGVSGNPGATINLDSRQHTATDIAFQSSTSLSVTGYPYTTYRVQVPLDQLAWQISVVASNGNPNVAVRRNFVPNENYNDAFSEVPGNVTDSISLVPPTLSDGTFYITVYSTNSHIFVLQSGPPVVTDINFTSMTTNDDPNRAGWRYYRITDLNQQLGTLGWDLFLQNFAPGTRIGLRRNAVPSLWSFRNNGALSTSGFYDMLSAADFLQHPAHQADVWYVGVYSPNTALGAFTLVAQPLTAQPMGFDSASQARVGVPTGKWQFFQFNVPPDSLGWDLRFSEVTNGSPRIVVRRDLLPTAWTNLTAGNIPWSSPGSSFSFPSGNQWKADQDWTRRSLSSDGGVDESGRILEMGMGQPLEPGNYFVGVIDVGGSNSMSYTLLSRGIGTNYTIPITDLAYQGGTDTRTLAPREVAYYRFQIASNTPSWKVRLGATSGEVMLINLSNHVENVDSGRGNFGKLMQKIDNEHYVLLPQAGKSSIPAGIYYMAVVSEGIAPASGSRIGSGSSTYTFTSQGPLPILDLGTLTGGGADITKADSLEGGEVKAYTFSTSVDAVALELRLEDRTGNPVMVVTDGGDVPDPGQGDPPAVNPDSYGNEGGVLGAAAPDLLTCANCGGLFSTMVVKARGTGQIYSNATYTIRIHSVSVDPLDFDTGVATVPVQTWGTWHYWEVNVPTNALGWDIRVTDATGAGVPHMVIQRDALPGDFVTLFNGIPGNATNWSSYSQWAAHDDWTRRSQSATGVNESGRLLAMGMGRPLEPGTYYVGVLNDLALDGADSSYTIHSRGIGLGYSIPVTDLAYTGGVSTHPGLAPREAAYYRVEVPAGSPSWQVKVSTNAGEVMLLILSNNVPNVDSGRAGVIGKLMQKFTSEQYVLLPTNGQASLPGGTYYLAVVGEGNNTTNATRIGVGTNTFTITSVGPMTVTNLGPVTADSDLIYPVAFQEGGETRGFQFTLPAGISSLEVHLDNRVGNPVMVVRQGVEMPDPAALYPGGSADDYGSEGGYQVLATATNAGAGPSLVTLPNPAAGVYSLVVKARGTAGSYGNASYNVRISALSFTDVTFDGGSATISNQLNGTWRYFRINVPTNTLGWDLRLTNVTNGTPKLVVRRDLLPSSTVNVGWAAPATSTNWPSGNQWAANTDWTLRQNSSTGSSENFRILAMGMGLPLEAGTYYVGVLNSGATTNLSYTLLSRGIGDGMTLPVTDLAFNGGSVTNSGLTPREAAYYRVQIPSNSPSLKIRLATVGGEVMMVTEQGKVPAVDSGRVTNPGKAMQKAGNEHYLLVPASGQSVLTPGTIYIAVISEGVNPANSSQIGSGSSSFTITCQGSAPIINLGTIGPADLTRHDTLEGGESKVYQVNVPAGMAIDERLENRIGNPVLVVKGGPQIPYPGAAGNGLSTDDYGNEGGSLLALVTTNNYPVPSPTNSIYTLVVKARASIGVYPDADYTLRVRQVPVIDLNFSSELNSNGLNNVASGLLADNQRAYYRVVVPKTVNGVPVIGWRLELSQSSGTASLRVRQNLLPDDAIVGMPPTPATSIIAPPYLTNGTWYVEVRGSNSTAFNLVSKSLVPEKVWAMPAIGQPSTTPGLVAPNFGDTGVDTNGVALPGDQGTDLAQGSFHYFAVTVPPTNVGIMRVQLTAISGNPDLYIRTNFVPTITHRTDGQSGTIFDRSLAGSVSEYGNFVPLSGRTEFELLPGTWYIAVRASGNANARYRLRLAAGVVQDLSLQGGFATGQVVAGADWRYYRVQFPQDGPTNWWVTFNQQAGDVVMYVRDTVPPGNGTSATDYRDWNTDNKNIGPYPSYDAPGTYLISTPQLREGSVYYLGFRANNDATFSISNNVAGGNFLLYPTINFYGGSVSNVLAPNTEITYRIYAPRDATRWKHTSTHVSGVGLYIENGFLPTKTASDDWRSTTANSTLNQYLLTGWPWEPNANYYLTITNTTASTQPYTFTMDGRNALTDDNDLDGMPDAWERQYFGGSTSPTAAGDYDGDGVSNLNEYLEGTNPADNQSFNPRLTIVATNGVVNVSPLAPYYSQGAPVSLTATPNAGYTFIGWSGDGSGTVNPLNLVMSTNRNVTAIFRAPGDDFAQRIVIPGWSNTVTSVNTNATKEPGEPNHAGNVGGHSVWWTWTALSSGNVTLTTAGSSFNTLLAVYTGNSVSNLTPIAANDNDSTNTTSRLTFAAVAGLTYAIAVDGFGGATGSIVLQLKADTAPIILGTPVRLGDGRFQFTLTAEAGYDYDIQASGNMVDWVTIATVPNPTGTLTFIDPNAALYPLRYYRATRALAVIVPLKLMNPTVPGVGLFSLTVSGPTGQLFHVEASTDFTHWTTLGNFTNSSGTVPFTDTNAATFIQRYYRVVAP